MKACPTADFRFSARARIPLLANDQGTTLVIRWEINSLASLFRGEKVKGSKRSPIDRVAACRDNRQKARTNLSLCRDGRHHHCFSLSPSVRVRGPVPRSDGFVSGGWAGGRGRARASPVGSTAAAATPEGSFAVRPSVCSSAECGWRGRERRKEAYRGHRFSSSSSQRVLARKQGREEEAKTPCSRLIHGQEQERGRGYPRRATASSPSPLSLPDGSHRSSESDPTRFTAFLLPSGSFTYDVRTEGEGGLA